jgi:hypothetical protein
MPGSRTNHDSLTTSAEGANENSQARSAASAGKTEGREKSRQGRLIILQPCRFNIAFHSCAEPSIPWCFLWLLMYLIVLSTCEIPMLKAPHFS